MNRWRTWTSILLGLTLLLQGLAVSASPRANPADEARAALEASARPCHGQEAAPSEAEAPCCCCDADCPDMTACALGQLAVVSTLSISLTPSAAEPYAAESRHAVFLAPVSPLRPPIPLHG